MGEVMNATMRVHRKSKTDNCDQPDNSNRTVQYKVAQFFLKSLSGFLDGAVTRVLVFVLALQLVLAVTLLASDRLASREDPKSNFVTVDKMVVDSITIEDENNSLTITLSDDQWNLPDALPANKKKINELLDKLGSLTPTLPIATTKASHKQLDVAQTNFQRRVQLNDGTESVAVLYIGSSPGFRKAHIRQADSTSVYVAPINVFDMPTSTNDWLDKSVLSFEGITRIDGPDFSITKSTDGKWTLLSEEQAESSELDTDQVNGLVATLEGLQVTSIALDGETKDLHNDNADSSTNDAEDPAGTDVELSHTDTGQIEKKDSTSNISSTVTLTVIHKLGYDELTLFKNGEQYAATRSDRSTRFTILPGAYNTISAATRKTLLNKSSNDAN